ncbi:AAA family ATPase [Sorangium sp. So ce291]|uniref:AAA family ATPase n=1 Tax=Sorangium sp. So ce291 TaxID=3133294 RepID=UPI003F5F68D6
MVLSKVHPISLDADAPHPGAPLEIPMDTERFLGLGVRLSLSLADLHDAGAIHAQLSPLSIRAEEGDEGVCLIAPPDSDQELEQIAAQALSQPDLLPYISPEMTGRTNRPVDHRSDLYSLGAIFHELLTGAPPFRADDLIEWIHCHVARRPRPLTEAAPAVPAMVSEIVLKLLAKTPEERYQTARGLAYDLGRCLDAVSRDRPIDPFQLGARDIGERLQIPRKIYGRDGEVAALLQCFEQTASTGTPALALVTGRSGIGKSSLVKELERPALQARGAFVAGKFEQYRRSIPYATLAQQFGGLVRRLLTESEARLDAWRKLMQEALGSHGQLIIDVIPQVELIIGKQPPVEPLPVGVGQNRFLRTFQQFVSVLARREHPLVLFLDDLQWADTGSIRLLQQLLTHPHTRYLLVVGAYRDGEVGRAHPLASALDEIVAAGVPIHPLPLGPLSREATRALVADALRCDAQRSAPLADRVHDKTGGNPFFATQLLSSLQKDGLLRLDREAGAWRWDLHEIDERGLADDSADLLLGKLKRLPGEVQAALKLGACLGAELDIDALALAADAPASEVRERLREAAREGFVALGASTCRFLHDRVREVAYSLLQESERPAVHLEIGRRLEAAGRAQLDVFDVVGHLNLGAPLIRSRDERERVARLNLEAGRKAKASAAHRSASDYLAAGIAMLADDAWETQHELAYALHFERAECEQQNGDLDEAERLSDLLLEHATTLLHKAPVHRLKIEIRTSRFSPDTMPCILETLNVLGIDVPARPEDAAVSAAFEQIWRALGDRPVEALLELPPMTDPERQATMSTLAVTYVASWFMDPNVAHLTTASMVLLSIEHGNADASALAYCASGMALAQRFGDHRSAHRFSKVGHELAERRGSAYWRGVAGNIFGGMVSPWTQSARKSLAVLRGALDASVESGNLIFMAFNSLQVVAWSLLRGEPLEDVYRTNEARIEAARISRFVMVEHCLVAIRRFIEILRGRAETPSTWDGAAFDQAAFEAKLADGRSPLAALWYHVLRLAAHFLLGDLDGASRSAAAAKELEWAEDLQPTGPDHHFYAALTVAAARSGGEDARREQREALAGHEERLRRFAANCPENFAQKHTLVLAEIARIEGRDLEAMRLYDRAICSARDSGFVQDEGVCSEVAARFYLDRGMTAAFGAHLKGARDCYARWGAALLVSRLEERYPDLLEQSVPISILPASESRSRLIDAVVVVRALQSISGEIVLDRLLTNLLRVVVEHAAAQRCKFLLVQEGRITLAARTEGERGTVEIEEIEEGEALPASALPMSLIAYVRRAREHVILDDASADSTYSSDEYFARRQARSVLCMPIMRSTSLVGVLYLENDLTKGAFTADRLAILDLLAKQAAISVENAMLYDGLQRENAERKRAEEALRQQLELIGRQQEAIRLLSTPIIEVWEGVLTMPVFGIVDSQRAAQMMDALLEAVVRRSCRYAILDLTGVEVVDSMTASHVIQIVRAVQLLGAQSFVVGLRSDVAHTIVSLGIDLRGIRTLGNLRQALVACMRDGAQKAQPRPV